MTDSMFIRVSASEDKASMLDRIVSDLLSNRANADAHAVPPSSFRQIPGAPLAYWVSDRVRRIFVHLSAFGSSGRTAKQGLATADDFRFVRAWWEVNASSVIIGDLARSNAEYREMTFQGRKWAPLGKGGAFSRYYADVHLLVNWERDGEEIRNFVDPLTRRPFSRPQNVEWYFRPGITWSLRTQGGLSFRPLPAGCIFSTMGSTAFAPLAELRWLLAIANSKAFFDLVTLQMAFGTYQVGTIMQTPMPTMDADQRRIIGDLAIDCVRRKMSLDSSDEVSHVFSVPALLTIWAPTLQADIASRKDYVTAEESKIALSQQEIDISASSLYGLAQEDWRDLESAVSEGGVTDSGEVEAGESYIADVPPDLDGDADTDEYSSVIRNVMDLLSYAVGCTVGRWDIRLATGERTAPPLPDPFAPLPACSPGMLVGDDGFPVTMPPPGYPLAIVLDGLLVDDPGDEWDIVRRVTAVLDLLWPGRGDTIASEACALLGVQDLRDVFRTSTRFFDDHIKRYSKSRRKAPIYWLLQSPKKHFGIWLYYHRLDADLVFKALERVQRKIALEEQRRDDLRAAQQAAGETGAAARKAARELERQEATLADIEEFRDRLDRAAKLHLTPDLDDGVILNIAPLRDVVPWREPKTYWRDLVAGKYPWSSIAKQLAERRARGEAIE